MPLISVIVPIYNTEKYLPKCLDSILAQTYTNWEAILIDDGSPDNCGKICDEYAAKDKRFKVIHQVNGGVSAARLNGFKLCRGEYISFVDSDDTLPQNALERLHSETFSNHLLICGSMTLVYPNHQQQQYYEIDKVIESSEVIKSILLFERKYSWELWGKLFHHSILDVDTLTVPNSIKVFEDYVITLRVLNKIKAIKYISQNTYNYIERDNSATQTNIFNFKKVENLSKEIEFACKNGYYKKELTRCNLQMLGWIINDEQLNRKSKWYKTLRKNSKEIRLGKIETLYLWLVILFKKGKTREKILKFFFKSGRK